MSWGDKVLTSGTKSDDTQLARVMQIILHYQEKGVERSKLMEILDDDSNSDDVHHLMRSVLYNARKNLRESGLPESGYIEFRNGRYYWTDDIKVFEDALYFEELVKSANEETDTDVKERLYRQACYIYKGEFLPQQTRLTWVSREEQKYSELFRRCVREYSDILRKKGDYAGLERLGRYASRVSSYNDWETLTIEALVELGRYRDAQEMYHSTIESYQKELGVTAALNMIDRLDAFSARLMHRSTDPEVIRQRLSEEEVGSGGFYCPYPVFQGIYQQMKRSLRRDDTSPFLMICTLADFNIADRKYHPSHDEPTMSGLSDRIKDIICSSVSYSDVVCRYARDQFMIILAGRTIEECGNVSEKIERNVKRAGYSFSLEYDISPVTALEESA